VEDREVVVVGGGPAGATAALTLRQAGHDVLLLDEARFPRDKICGEALSPGAWRVIESVGAAPAVSALGPWALSGMRLTAPDGTSFCGRYDGGRTLGFSVERRTLDATLLDRAREAGVEVREGTPVSGPLVANGAVLGVQVGDARIRARIVIAADGRRSAVARRLGLLREAAWPRRFAVRGHWQGVAGLGAFGEMHVGGGGYCGVAPLGPALANVAFVLDQSAMRAAGSDLPGFYRATLRRWPQLWERLESATLREPPRAIGPLALEASRVWAPGVLLVGDAAGFFDPFTGEGIGIALRTAMLAADVAHDALARGTPLGVYAARHRALAREKFRFNRWLQWIVRRPAVANVAARALSTRPALADRLVGLAGDCLPEREGRRPGLVAGLLWGR
jgi:geranylgeranyl reductase family protein